MTSCSQLWRLFHSQRHRMARCFRHPMRSSRRSRSSSNPRLRSGQDDTPGWFYQSVSTTRRARTAAQEACRVFTADHLGPINQFFTPAWIVRFLVDNTRSERSGAAWLRKVGLPSPAPCCCPPPTTTRHGLLSVPASHQIIDPACVRCISGAYAFDALSSMHQQEGIEDRRDVPCARSSKRTWSALISTVALIQIAALNLYLKAATALSMTGEERPANLRMDLGLRLCGSAGR